MTKKKNKKNKKKKKKKKQSGIISTNTYYDFRKHQVICMNIFLLHLFSTFEQPHVCCRKGVKEHAQGREILLIPQISKTGTLCFILCTKHFYSLLVHNTQLSFFLGEEGRTLRKKKKKKKSNFFLDFLELL